uniref:SCP domain-containing protein n=1 Tax=Cacopsylla melanoneura TaxID=428564 RepID=A0A8D8RCB3_9HEMI
MMSKSGTMLSLVVLATALLVQDTFQQPPPAQQAEQAKEEPKLDKNPFENLPKDLEGLKEWNLDEPAQRKLQDLALFGLNKFRENNGETEKLTTKENIYKASFYQAKKLCDDVARIGPDTFDLENYELDHRYFTRNLGHVTDKEVEKIPTGELVISTLMKWLAVSQETLKKGTEKGEIACLNPETKYVGLGLCRKTAEWDNKMVTHYGLVLDFGTEVECKNFTTSYKPTP